MPPEADTPAITPVILAGGRGTRLWPLTSQSRPKPFLRVFSKHSLFQETLRRVCVFAQPVIVTEEAYLPFVQTHMDEIGAQARHIVVEPAGRNTGPAVIAAAACLRADNPLMLILPSDHVIKGVERFRDDVARLAKMHRAGTITLLGVRPRGANPQYGYIVPGEEGEGGLHQVECFVEKPGKHQAQDLIEERNALWHTGMFLCYAQDLCDSAARVAPDLYKGTVQSLPSRAFEGGACISPRRESYLNLPSISIDYTILEQVEGCAVGEIDIEWSDVGSWSGLIRTVLCSNKLGIKK